MSKPASSRSALRAAVPAALVFSLLAGSALPALADTHAPVTGLRFIGEQRLEHKMDFKGTVVGGLSGIDWSPRSGEWIAISDDKSDQSPARFYTLALEYDADGFKAVTVKSVVTLLQADGTAYPNKKDVAEKGGVVPDPESIRFDPADGSIWYTSEGDRKLGFNPFIRHASPDGAMLGELPLNPMFAFHKDEEIGPRDNLTFEGLSFAADGKSLWLGLEAPRYQDGPIATPEAGAVTRISHLALDGKMLAQFAYPLDAIPGTPGKGKSADNGMPEVLAVNEGQLLALERSGIEDDSGAWTDHIRLYAVDLAGASDVSGINGLQGQSYTALTKKLVFNLDTLGLKPLDNVEGVTFGPKLANGHDTLVFVSDDNFNKHEVTQFLAFEVLN
ncbi:esterase-like activity of phytase family protein [Radicibacter daui]|uniref:esterase-like activity of phytase family protein n=1 Tax=Radicibacter daui TaxID=3064829 RepID=UPI004046AC8A